MTSRRDDPAGVVDEQLPASVVEALDADRVEPTVHALEKLGLEFAVPTNPKLEKLGLERFARHDAAYPALPTGEAVHILDAAERQAIRRHARTMILWAFFIGACSGLVSSIASFLMAVPEGVATTFERDVLEFAIVNGVTIGATAIEVVILYRIALRVVHLIAREAGIALVPRAGVGDTDERRAVALALARAALELPNPPQNPFGIDPYRDISKWRVVLTTIFYKLKISLTNFVIRLLIRRIGGRVIVKAYLTFTDVLVTGTWDAIVAWRMVRQARVRAIGPSACEALLGAIVRDEGPLSNGVAVAMLRAVAASIVRSHEVHPNLLALMRAIVRRSGGVEVKDLDDTRAFLGALDTLSARERDVVIEVLVLASFADGRVRRSERDLLAALASRDGRTLDRRALTRAARRFARGDELGRADLRCLVGR